MSAAKNQPATPLPRLAVQWNEAKERVSLITLGNHPHDCVLAASKDSGKGDLYERIAHACNAYPKLVALAKLVPSMEGDISTRALAKRLLRELGESA